MTTMMVMVGGEENKLNSLYRDSNSMKLFKLKVMHVCVCVCVWQPKQPIMLPSNMIK
jgi:hypothetical protein